MGQNFEVIYKKHYIWGKSGNIYKLRKIIHVSETLVNWKDTILVFQFLLPSWKKFQQVKEASDNHNFLSMSYCILVIIFFHWFLTSPKYHQSCQPQSMIVKTHGENILYSYWLSTEIHKEQFWQHCYFSPATWSSMHWNTVSKQCRCWAIITSLSGMNEKFRMIFEAPTAHCCFSVRPSSSRLNKPSSSNHHSEERTLAAFFCTNEPAAEEPDPTLPHKTHYSHVITKSLNQRPFYSTQKCILCNLPWSRESIINRAQCLKLTPKTRNQRIHTQCSSPRSLRQLFRKSNVTPIINLF